MEIFPRGWQTDLSRLGAFNLIAWFLVIPFDVFRLLTTQCNFLGHSYDVNLWRVPLVLFCWWALSYLNALWLRRLAQPESAASLRLLRHHSLRTSLATLLLCLGVLALPAFIAWYAGAAVASAVVMTWYHKRAALHFPRFTKSFLAVSTLYALLAPPTLLLIAFNSIGAVECTGGSYVKGNMHAFQNMLGAYSVEQGHLCPSSWQILKQKPYWKELANPLAYATPAVITHPEQPEKGWPPYLDILGIRFYFHRQHAGAVSYAYTNPTACRIYGFNGSGQLLRQQGGEPFYLTPEPLPE